MSSNERTIVITDIENALTTAEREAKEKNACLLAMGGELNGTIFELPPGETTIGRGTENSIPLEFQGISRNHLKLAVTEASVVLTDAGSTNGTYLNNSKVEMPITLSKGDIIKIGIITLKYIAKGDPERLTYDKLHQKANTDGLTGCYNKVYFINALDTEVKKCKVTGTPLTLIILDLDHFKKLNDGFGHDAGDFVLKNLAQLVRSGGVREGDTFARYGGEEFVILLPKTNLKQGFEIAERLRKLVEQHHFVYDDKRLPVTMSVGVADYRQGVGSGTDLFKRADQAVYKSKEQGRNQVSFYKNDDNP